MSKLLSPENYYLQDTIDTYLDWVRGYNNKGMPRFDQCSIIAQRTRVLLYDNPLLAMSLGGTACVIKGTPDIYMYAPFAQSLMEKDLDAEAKKGTLTTNIPFVLLHELSHKVLEHVESMGHWEEKYGVSPQSSNKGMDTIINIGLLQYPEIEVTMKDDCVFDVETFTVTQGYYGLTDYERQLFGAGRASALEVSRHYQDAEDKFKAQQEQEQGKGEDAKNEQSSEENNGSEQNGNDESNKNSASSDGGDFGLEHVSDVKELVDALNEAGLGDLVDRLGYPKSDQEVKEAMEAERANTQSDLEKFEKLKSEAGVKAGGHIDQMTTQSIKANKNVSMYADLEHVLTYDLELGKDDMFFDDDTPSEQFLHDPAIYGMEERVWEGTQIPVTPSEKLMVIADTSGSMNDERLAFSLGAIQSALFDIPSVKEIVFVDSDTVVRDMVILESDELMDMEDYDFKGRGGTDIAQVMVEAIAKACNEMDINIKAVIYLSDMECYIPDRHGMETLFTEHNLGQIPPTAFLVPPKAGNQQLFDQVKDWATVTEIGTNKHFSFEVNQVTQEASHAPTP